MFLVQLTLLGKPHFIQAVYVKRLTAFAGWGSNPDSESQSLVSYRWTTREELLHGRYTTVEDFELRIGDSPQSERLLSVLVHLLDAELALELLGS